MDIKESKLYQDKEWLQKQFDELGHTRDIANTFGISEWTVDHWAKRLDITKSLNRRMSSRTHKLNEDFFEVIDNELKAYWLGFIMADGCVTQTDKRYPPNRFQLCLKDSDIEHINKLILALECDYKPVTKLVRNKKRGFESYTSEVKINSKSFVSRLATHGITMNKTGKEILPSTIPDKFIRDFIRGYFDGDGSLTSNGAFRICSSSKIILEQINNNFSNKLGIHFTIYCSYKYKEPFYTIDSRHSKNIKKVLDYLYKDSNIYLDRKYYRYIRYSAQLQSDL